MERPLLRPAKTPSLTKVAYRTRLEDEPNEWPAEITKKAYDELPWLRDFEIDVELDRVEEARGYAVGRMLVYPTHMKKQAAAEQRKLISIPVIVREREMAPLDVFMHEKQAWPMDEERAQTLLFSPNMFIGSSRLDDFGASDLAGQIRPPASDQRYATGALHKQSSVRPEGLLKTAAPTFDLERVLDFGERLNQDVVARQAFSNNPDLLSAARTILQEGGRQKTAEQRHDRSPPDVIQFRRAARGYTVKTASHRIYAPREEQITSGEVQEVLGAERFEKLRADGYYTVVRDPVIKERLTEKRAQEARRTGRYTVSVGAGQAEGFVVPHVISLTGENLGSLFIGQNNWALQEKIAAVWQRDDRIESGTEPRGYGVFVYQSGPRAFATEPIHVRHLVKEAEGLQYYLIDRTWRDGTGRLYKVAGLRQITNVGPNDWAIPDEMEFHPIHGSRVVVPQDVASAQEFEHGKTASPSAVELVSDGSQFEIRAEPFRGEFLDRADVEFALGALGVTAAQSREAMKVASEQGVFTIAKTRTVVPESEVVSWVATKTAAAMQAAVARVQPDRLRASLLDEVIVLTQPSHNKTASVILNKETVDAILSLDFINPANMSMYADYISDLEKTSNKLAEVLIASRLGMEEVKEAAAKNAMSQVNMVIHGLRSLRSKIT